MVVFDKDIFYSTVYVYGYLKHFDLIEIIGENQIILKNLHFCLMTTYGHDLKIIHRIESNTVCFSVVCLCVNLW